MISAEQCLYIALLQDHRSAIRALCRPYRVLTLDVFGSLCRPGFTENSGIDVLVDVPPNHGLGPWLRDDQHVPRDLSDLLQRDVDLGMTYALRKPLFRDEVEATRTRIFDAAAGADAAWRQQRSRDIDHRHNCRPDSAGVC